jgi:hypothetical protein
MLGESHDVAESTVRQPAARGRRIAEPVIVSFEAITGHSGPVDAGYGHHQPNGFPRYGPVATAAAGCACAAPEAGRGAELIDACVLVTVEVRVAAGEGIPAAAGCGGPPAPP